MATEIPALNIPRKRSAATLALAAGLSRRQVIGAGAGLIFLVRDRQSGDARGQDATPGSGWTYTDIHGNAITLPQRPERVAAMITPGAALWDFGVRPAGIFAWEAMVAPDGSDPAWGNIDASAVANVGGGDAGNLDPERLVALGADLVITTGFDDATPYVQIDPETVAQIEQIVPVAAAYQPAPAIENLKRMADLAQRLGADLDSPENREARESFEATLAEFEKLVAEKQDLTVLVIDPYEAEYGVVAPRDFDDLAWLADLGVNFVGLDFPAGTWFEPHSAEQALAYEADVVLISSLAGRLSADELQAHPTYGQHPAIKVGQIGQWNQSYIPSYPQLTATLQQALDALRDAETATS